jgi:hypothetical protein
MFLPKLVNLSLANNQLRTMEDIRQLTREKSKLDFVRELVLTGNPIKGSDPANTEQYRRSVLFPSTRIHSPHHIDRQGYRQAISCVGDAGQRADCESGI